MTVARIDSPLTSLAALFDYPRDGLAARARECARALRDVPSVAAEVEQFGAAVAGLSTSQLQEQYTETFDFTESCALEIGWHIFGDTHERGAFMAGLRADMERAGITATPELPDHVTHVLALLASDPACARELRPIVAPAITQLHDALLARRSPYAHAMAAVRALIGGDETTGPSARGEQ